MTDQTPVIDTEAKEKEFDEEPTFNNCLTFRSHNKLVEKANKKNGLPKWEAQKYKAIQIRLQVDAEVEQWITIAENAGET